MKIVLPVGGVGAVQVVQARDPVGGGRIAGRGKTGYAHSLSPRVAGLKTDTLHTRQQQAQVQGHISSFRRLPHFAVWRRVYPYVVTHTTLTAPTRSPHFEVTAPHRCHFRGSTQRPVMYCSRVETRYTHFLPRYKPSNKTTTHERRAQHKRIVARAQHGRLRVAPPPVPDDHNA